MQTVAQQVLVYRLTGSAMALGIVNLMALIPLVPMSLWGGSLSDGFPKRTVVLVTQSGMLIQALLLGILVWTDAVQVWHVYILALLLGALKAVDMPSRQAFVVEMVENKDDVTNAIGLNSVVGNGAKTLGPALAGVMVAGMGEAVAFFANAGSFIAVIAGLFLMRDLPQTCESRQKSAGLVSDIAEGVRFVLKEQALVVLMIMVAVNNLLSLPITTLMPVFANVVLKQSATPLVELLCGGEAPLIHCQAPEALPLGLLLAALGVGAIIGGILVASIPDQVPRGRALTLGNLGVPFFLLLFVASNSMALSLALMVTVGISRVLQNAVANALLQTSSPDTLRGRVMGLYGLTNQGAENLGGAQAGFAADWIGAQLSIGVGAAAALALTLYLALRYPKVREMS
jgi:MFS family permease